MRLRLTTVLGGIAVALLIGATLVLSGTSTVSAENATEVAAGGDHSCAIVGDGEVVCWGNNDNGQLGNNDAPNDSSAPVNACMFFLLFCSNISGTTDISAGYAHTCAVTEGGGVLCWGDNDSGQLGNNDDPNDSDSPVNVCATTPLLGTPCESNLTNVEQVAVGDFHSCALITGGTVKCWGSNFNGQLGNGYTTDSPTPINVCTEAGVFFCNENLTDVVQIAAGGQHTCALHSDGSVSCWGDDDNGQLGNNGATGDSELPVTVCAGSVLLIIGPCDADLANVSSIGAGLNHTCAVITTGNVRCWGDNSSGQLGNGYTEDRFTPVTVCTDAGLIFCDAALGDVAEVRDLGDLHSCVLTDEGGAACWGENAVGQLGDSDMPNDSLVAVNACRVVILILGCSPVLTFTSVSTGDDHTCAATIFGGIQCWGENDPNGQIGDGTTANRDEPTSATTLGSKPTPTPTPTATSSATPTSTPTSANTATPSATPTATSPGPTATPTATSPGPTPTATATSPGGTVVGDVDCDGMVTAIDAAILLQFVAGLIGSVPCPDEADVDGSGDLTAIDAALILQAIAGLLTLPL